MHVSSVRAVALMAFAAALSVFTPSSTAAQTVDEIVTKHIAASSGRPDLEAIEW